MHWNEELDRLCIRDAPVGTPQWLFELEYLEQYPTCLDVGRFRCMQTDGHAFPVQDCLGRQYDMAFARWAKRWDPWGGRGALRCHCAGKEMDSPLVCFREEVDYKRRLVQLLPWMREH